MRSEKGRHDLQRHFLFQSAYNAQNLQFIFNHQAVTGFRFDCCSPATQEPVRMLFCLREKIAFAGSASFFYR
jgi:hypothetical protein